MIWLEMRCLVYRWNHLGYVASFITFCGATIFWISTITGVPGVLPDEATHIAEWDVLFWFPQVRPRIKHQRCALVLDIGGCMHPATLADCVATSHWQERTHA